MAVTMDQVKAALYPEEPDYPKAARQLGAEALPHLDEIVGGSDTLLAAKAAYLAGLIGGDASAPVVAKAARSGQVTVRIAAAAAAAHLPAEHSDAVLLQLVDDADRGVQKVALRSVPAKMSAALRSRVRAVSQAVTIAAPTKARAAARKKRAKRARKARTTRSSR